MLLRVMRLGITFITMFTSVCFFLVWSLLLHWQLFHWHYPLVNLQWWNWQLAMFEYCSLSFLSVIAGIKFLSRSSCSRISLMWSSSFWLCFNISYSVICNSEVILSQPMMISLMNELYSLSIKVLMYVFVSLSIFIVYIMKYQ